MSPLCQSHSSPTHSWWPISWLIARALLGVLVTTFTSLAGGLGAYLVAALFTETLLGLASPETLAEFNSLATTYSESSLALGFLGAITPIPFTLAALVAGALQGNPFLFLIGAFTGRIIRYGITGYLTYHYGEGALSIAARNIKPITVVAVTLTILYLWLVM